MKLIQQTNTRGIASETQLNGRIEWYSTTNESDEHDLVQLVVNGNKMSPTELRSMGIRITDTTRLERRLLAHGGYANLVVQ
jgi:hypothetical protein